MIRSFLSASVCLVAIVLTFPPTHAASQVARESLDRCSGLFDDIRDYSLRMTLSTTRVDGDTASTEPDVQTIFLRRKDEVFFLQLGDFESKSASITQRYFNGKEYIEITLLLDSDGEYQLDAVSSALKFPSDDYRRQIDDSAWCYLFGRFPGTMRPKSIKPGTFSQVLFGRGVGKVESSSNEKIQWTGAGLTATISLVPDRSFTVAEIVLNRRGLKPGVRAVTSESFSVSEFADFDGLEIPSLFTVSQDLSKGVFEGAGEQAKAMDPVTIINSVQITEFNPNAENSEEDFRLAVEIPEGFPVHAIDGGQLRYKWSQGRMVPATDAEALDSMRRYALNQSLALENKRGFSFWISIIIIGSAIILAIYLAMTRKGA